MEKEISVVHLQLVRDRHIPCGEMRLKTPKKAAEVIRDLMGKCIYEGVPVTPEMPGCCSRCGLYLNTCAPVIRNGFLAGAECDMDYCEFCPVYGDCGVYFAVREDNGHAVVV